MVEQRVFEPAITEWHETRTWLSDLVYQRQRSVLRISTDVDIAKNTNPSGTTQYVLFIQHPFTADDLITILEDFSNDPFNPEEVSASWRKNSVGNTQFDPQIIRSKHMLAGLLTSREDGDFIDNLASRLQTEGQMWSAVLRGQTFPLALLEAMTQKVPDIILGECAARIPRILRGSPEYWPAKPRRSIARVSDRVALGRFGQLGQQARGEIIDRLFGDGEDALGKKRRLISLTYRNIQQEFTNVNNQKTFLLGHRQNEVVDRYSDQSARIVNDMQAAVVNFEDDGSIIIHPQSTNFHVPYLQWEVDSEGQRRFIFGKPGKLVRDSIIIKPTPTSAISIEYQYRDGQVNNSLLGLIIGQYLHGNYPVGDVSLESLPSRLLLNQEELLQSDFIQNAEEVSRTS